MRAVNLRRNSRRLQACPEEKLQLALYFIHDAARDDVSQKCPICGSTLKFSNSAVSSWTGGASRLIDELPDWQLGKPRSTLTKRLLKAIARLIGLHPFFRLHRSVASRLGWAGRCLANDPLWEQGWGDRPPPTTTSVACEKCPTAPGRIVSQSMKVSLNRHPCAQLSQRSSQSSQKRYHDVKRVRRDAEWMLSIPLSVSTSTKPSLAAFATRSAGPWRPRDGAKPQCCAPDEEEGLFTPTDPSLAAVVALC